MASILTTIIRYAYYALFFVTPFLVTPWNYELFEFNKMLFVYAIGVIVASAWVARMILEKKVFFRSTILDIPIIAFLISHLISTVYSIDPHMSIWGYYGRFNGGLISLFCYLILYYGLVSNIKDSNENNIVLNFILLSLASGILVSIYGIAQHFGIDAHLWVQDVQNRVFSTLGQPNWLAAYLAIVLPMSFAFLLSTSLPIFLSKQRSFIVSLLHGLMVIVPLIFYVTLLFTKSRSGFIAFWIVNMIFWTSIFVVGNPWFAKINKARQGRATTSFLKSVIGINTLLIIITILIGSPFEQINHYFSFMKNDSPTTTIEQTQDVVTEQTATSESSDMNITDSGDIRKLVWQGALDATGKRPWFGWGVETFAWVYYRFKPVAHNMTSEWDFLYNKAHNEYLNYAATTGLVGLGSYLLIIGTFIVWVTRQEIKKLRKKEISQFPNFPISIGLFAAWLSILITNFFGFSVFVTSLYFWTIPALIMVSVTASNETVTVTKKQPVSLFQWAGIGLTIGIAGFLVVSLVQFWRADYYFARAQSSIRGGDYYEGSQELLQAVRLRPFEPGYQSYLTNAIAPLAVARFEEEANASEKLSDDFANSSDLVKQTITSSDLSLKLSPGNVTFWKTRTRMFYTLSEIDQSYAKNALDAVLTAQSLAPNDPQITYNVGIVYELNEDTPSAIERFKRALDLKPDYRDAAWALAIFYEQEENEEETKKWLQYILDNIDPNDGEVKQKLGIE